jgi:hypothetical protein
MNEVDFARRYVVQQTPDNTAYVEHIARIVLGRRPSPRRKKPLSDQTRGAGTVVGSGDDVTVLSFVPGW